MPTVTIIGIGRVGGALAKSFEDSEYVVENLIGRVADPASGIKTVESVESIESDIVLIAVGDSSIASVAYSIAPKISPSSKVLHLSGSLSSTVLSDLSAIGCSIGSMHPLVSISSPQLGVERFRGAYFCVEGDSEATDRANSIVTFLGGTSFSIATDQKALYHAAAVTASGHLAALIDLASEMMKRSGVSEEMALKILTPLIRSTIENILVQGPSAALTGPFARADASVFDRQTDLIEKELTSDEAEIYLDLALRSLELAARQHANADKIAELETKIRMTKVQRCG